MLGLPPQTQLKKGALCPVEQRAANAGILCTSKGSILVMELTDLCVPLCDRLVYASDVVRAEDVASREVFWQLSLHIVNGVPTNCFSSRAFCGVEEERNGSASNMLILLRQADLIEAMPGMLGSLEDRTAVVQGYYQTVRLRSRHWVLEELEVAAPAVFPLRVEIEHNI